jgi:hypothetical protein
MLIIRPNTKPAFWWLFPWAYARTLHTAANALRALTDSQEQAIVLQKHIIADQSEEIANLRRRVESLSNPLEWLPIESAPKNGSYFIGGTWGDMESRPTWAAMCSYRAEFNQFQMVETPDQPDFWLPLPKVPKGMEEPRI